VLAVLPLENLSGDPEEDYFGRGLKEDLVTRLGGLSPERLGVIAWNAAQNEMPLEADYVLEGSFRREDARVRVNVQLSRVRDRTYVWAESFERDLTGILDVQATISRAVAREIDLTLTPEKAVELSQSQGVDRFAYESYLRGLVTFSELFTPGAPHVVSHFERATERDPEFAQAHALLALSRLLLAFNGTSNRDMLGRAREAAEKALEIDPDSSEAHVALGVIALLFDWEWSEARSELERAIALNPGSPWVHWSNAFRLSFFGRHDEAIEAMTRARSLDPFNPYLSTCVGEMFWYARRYEEAEREWANVAVRYPSYSRPHLLSRLMYEGVGDYERAVEAYRLNRVARGDLFERIESLRLAYRSAGADGYWRWWLDRSFENQDGLRPGSTVFANLHARLGDMDRAFEYLEQAFEEKNPHLVLIQTPQFDALRGDPRFAKYVRRMNFPRGGLDD
jgi:TolB-like protein/tetratricopeptide (TPR) repeat protein